jgi:hypothetical protein
MGGEGRKFVAVRDSRRKQVRNELMFAFQEEEDKGERNEFGGITVSMDFTHGHTC